MAGSWGRVGALSGAGAVGAAAYGAHGAGQTEAFGAVTGTTTRRSSTRRPTGTTSCTAWRCWPSPAAAVPCWPARCSAPGWDSSAAPCITTPGAETRPSTKRPPTGAPS
ncbi:transmembrane protein 256 isoform X2 [Mauremys mutica]|uniref:transmembrane protein 256 isoform X2 n=1 Tax=Mauremys mutica TaxID=74926 RepID=UPI001D146D6E|nr:transmembrane protein 256 isoform X2 [Mauremys mutica]